MLEGEVGIFPLRLDDVMIKELNMLNQLRALVRQAGLVGEVTSIHIGKLSLLSLSTEEQKYAANIRQLTDDSVVFTASYLQEKLGDLPYELLYDPIFYNSV